MASSPKFKVRTITAFCPCTQKTLTDSEAWATYIRDALAHLQQIQQRLGDIGLEVQTIRVSTNILTDLLETMGPDIVDKAVELEKIAQQEGLQFLNLGTLRDRECICRPGMLSDLVSSLEVTSMSVDFGEGWGTPEALHLAREILAMERKRPGCTFRFGVSVNCKPTIPYFPASYSGPDGTSFALGLENSALLHQAYSTAHERSHSSSTCPLTLLQEEVESVFFTACQPIEKICMSWADEHGWEYKGIDASIAPDLRGPEHNLEECLKFPFGNQRPWGPGTPATIDAITKALKSLNVLTTGYCGVMLPVLENESLAHAASRGDLDIQKLLLYAGLCGIGLDTVPVPGVSDDGSSALSQQIQEQIAGYVLDIRAISNRQTKPLSVRLLPVIGAKPSDQTTFTSPYLINGSVMEL
ncbi:UPF0210 protein [Picochlorum sp. SENEW3]|nr:UPF0210 protein [Picochlorum sp. SENEW3]